MTIKVLDTCCLISISERIRCIDIIGICHEYDLICTEVVRDEFNKKGNLDARVCIHALTPDELKMSKVISLNEGIDIGETSAMVRAFSLNEAATDQTIFVTDDIGAYKTFQNLMKDEFMKNKYPKIYKLKGVDTVDLLNRQFDKGRIDSDDMKTIKTELITRIPQDRLDCLKT